MNERDQMVIKIFGKEILSEKDASDFADVAFDEWPQDFFGRLVAERMLKTLLALPYLPDRYTFENLRCQAFASLAAEGIKIPEGEGE